jgi:hypothetical protein
MPHHVMPQRRDLAFSLPADRITDWNDGSVHLSQFMNTLSIFFPEGERMFIDAVRAYRDRITDPELQKAVTAFIGQEAMHGREHDEYNEALYAAVPEARDMERTVSRLLDTLKKRTPVAWRLSATIALEHYTAIMADGLLRDPRILEHAEPRFAKIWTWHALEETEHKAVAFDVWDRVMGRGPASYALRAAAMLVATAIFWPLVVSFYLRILRAEGRLTDVKGWRTLFRYTFGEIGHLRKLILPWAEYFRPRFHPWERDNSHFLERIDALVAEVGKQEAGATAAA